MIDVSRTGAASQTAVSDDELAVAVLGAFPDRQVVRVERELSRHSTSATIDDVTVHLADGTLVPLILKDLTPDAWLDGARAGKPESLRDPRRELSVYRQLLPHAHDGQTAACLAAVDTDERQWLLLEKVPGVELYQVGEVEVWAASAATVAALHRDLTARVNDAPDACSRLLVHDAAYLQRWMQRALEFEARRGGAHSESLQALARVHGTVVERLLDQPRVVLHGDLYASNVLVVRGDPTRVCPVDWEYAALGPAVLDLAALTSGDWLEEERKAIADFYYAAMDDSRWRPDREGFGKALDLARLQVCVQWLGWSPEWTPPPEHAHDWLSEARRLGARLFA